VTAPHVRELLAACAAPRERLTDEHMFTVARDGFRMGTFRLQLFTADDARPVAIATQTAGEGASLTNRAEKYAAEAWRRHFPHLAEPPGSSSSCSPTSPATRSALTSSPSPRHSRTSSRGQGGAG
jgi:hypothetical protein